MTTTVLSLLAATGLLLVTAYLATVETVVTRVAVVRAMRLREEEARGGAALLWLTEHRATALSVLLVATVVTRVTLAAIVAVLLVQLVGNGAVGIGLAVLAVVVASLVLGEVVPRTIALRHLEPLAGAVAPSARLLVRTLQWPARLVVGLGHALVPRRHEVSGPYAADDELDESELDEEPQDEQLEPEERAMIRSIFELADTRVREIMVPRPDLVSVPEDATFDDLVGVVAEHGVSRIPVHDPEDPNQIVGIVYAKDLLRRAADRRRRWADLVRRPTFVPETKRCDELLRELQEATVHLALVVDEYGELVGLVTIEDILEEIVGEIVDEHDHVEPLVDVLDDERWRVDARLGVDDLNELLGADLPEEGWDTVGGLVFGTLGRVPVEGERIELDGIRLVVERVQGRRVAKVVVSRTT